MSRATNNPLDLVRVQGLHAPTDNEAQRFDLNLAKISLVGLKLEPGRNGLPEHPRQPPNMRTE